MKKPILILLILFIALSFFTAKVYAEYNLQRSEEKSIEINGEIYNFILYKYAPPYLSPQYYFKSQAEQDLSAPEGTCIAIRSSAGRNKEWYLSLFNEKCRQKMLELDKETDGEWLKENYKGTPFPDAIMEGNYSEFLYKVEFKINNQLYTVIYYNLYVEGEKMTGGHKLLVKTDNKWLEACDKNIEKNPLVWLVGLHDYDQLQQLCQKGYWYTPGTKKPVRLKVELSSDKKEYKHKESMNLKVKIENIWREDVTICSAFKPLGKTVRFLIESLENDISFTTDLITEKDIKPDEIITLKPNESREVSYDLTNYLKDFAIFLTSGNRLPYMDGLTYLPPGKYTIKAKYSTIGVEDKRCIIPREGVAWESEPINIEILPPDPQDEQAKESSLLGKKVKIYYTYGDTTHGKVIEEDKDSLKIRRDIGDTYVHIPIDKEDIERIEELE
jgi:hypothetical protein